jgi:transglutaminase-like putative cysteine protease
VLLAPRSAYLAPSEWIDSDHPDVVALARRLAGATVEETARRCFEWVRDEVRHSRDFQTGPVTCRASDALRHRTGYCYAKAHLLAALLRANGVPAALAYQRLSVNDEGAPYSLHGLVAVELPGHGWYRIDPRGNKQGVEAQFSPPVEQLAFAPRGEGERDLPGLHAQPLPAVVACLTRNATWEAALADLPDVP